MATIRYAPALLEEWMRDYYFTTDNDLGSSGVDCWSFGDLRRMIGIEEDELNSIVLKDSSSYGHFNLRESISKRWGNGDPNSVMVTHGSSEAAFLVLNSLLDAGDEVVVLHPCYHQLESIPKAVGCVIRYWCMDADHGFKVDLSELERLVNEQTKMVILNFPHNPTGVSISMEEFHEIIRIVSRVGAFLFWDGAFNELVYDTDPLPNPIQFYARSISTGTFSKAYGMPGLRFGWCMAAQEILERCIPIRDRMTLHLSPLIEYIAWKVILNIDLLLHMRLQQAKENLVILENWIKDQSEFVKWTKPQGGVTAFVKFLDLMDVDALCCKLGMRAKTLLVPGTCFGFPEYARLGFGGNTEQFIKGLGELGGYLGTRKQ